MAASHYCSLFDNRGSGESGHLGHGDDDHVRVPKLVSALSKETVVQVAVGSEHCLVLTETGGLYAWGKNSSGEVCPGQEPVTIPTLIEGVSSVTHISCGPTEVCMYFLYSCTCCYLVDLQDDNM